MISQIPCLSISAHHHFQVCSIGCSGLQIRYQLYYHTADSVLTSGCSFTSQYIWIKIWIVLVILDRSIKSKRSSTGKRCMWIRISSWQIDILRMLNSGIDTSCARWHFRQRWSQLLSRLSVSVRWWCACSFVSPSCLWILCSAIW